LNTSGDRSYPLSLHPFDGQVGSRLYFADYIAPNLCKVGSLSLSYHLSQCAIDRGLGVTYTYILWFRVNSSPAWPLFESLGS
jgi:hypothetical protein